MLFLSNAALRYAVDICQEKDGRRIGIAVKDEDKRDSVRELILSMVSDSDHVDRIVNSRYEFRIQFDNGSLIKLIFASESARGYRCHLLIADEEIPYDLVQNVLMRCEISDWYEYQLKHTND